MKKTKVSFFLVNLLILVGLSSCGVPQAQDNSGAGQKTTPESDFCTTNTTYSTPVTITGTARFFKRGLTVTQLAGTVTDMTLSTPISSALPVKFAEIRVYNSAGALVQCGQTNSVGALKALDGASNLTIPNTADTYSVEVLSRSQHTLSVPMSKTAFNFFVSVKEDIYSNSVYKITQSITSPGSGSVSATLTAYSRESESSSILGGAFNVYNSLLTAYEYLAQNTGTSDITCMNPKLNVYWKAGFNPAQYLYPSNDPSTLGTLSFYVRGENQLYINGGRLGNVTTQDTDHFDDAVIIHELGHHVEDVCGKMDSPGGTHYGLYRIDPRLSWSEGWGNFFGAHMIKNNTAALNPDLAAQLPSSGWLHYLDTQGYNDGATTSGSSLILLNLTRAGSNPESAGGGKYYDKVNSSSFPGEGHTREVSISRSLFKGTNTCTSGCTNTNYFSNYWKAFENDLTGLGMGKPTYFFRSSALFYNRLTAAFSGSMPAAIDSILNTDEAQQRDGNSAYTVSGATIWVPYGIKLINNGGSACSQPLKIQPRTDFANVTNGFSDQRYSNHFYSIDLSVLSGVTEINLSATNTAGSSVDIDLILLKEGYRFTEDCSAYDSNGTCTSFQKMTAADMLRFDRSNAATPGSSFTKKIQTLNALSTSSRYLLDVRAYTANQSISASTEYTYTLRTQTGDYLCPSTNF